MGGHPLHHPQPHGLTLRTCRPAPVEPRVLSMDYDGLPEDGLDMPEHEPVG